jgi:sigma-B regulation protein RsbU (phosphoserine phosphatase)
MPGIFETWNSRTIDKLFQLRYRTAFFRPSYNDTIVHIDLNNSSIHQLNQFYLNRSYHARVISNLSSMHVALQLYDFIFAANTNPIDDKALIEATASARNIYFGLAFQLGNIKKSSDISSSFSSGTKYLQQTKWDIRIAQGDSMFFTGCDPLVTFIDLAQVSKGLGFLNIQPDLDGVFRRVPLLVKYDGGYYPSLPFRAICDYLNVSPDHIKVIHGKKIILKDARLDIHQNGTDIVIPIDSSGNFRVNFIGPWESFKHYNFADVYRASEDKYVLELWAARLSGKIVVVSDVSTGSADIGPVPSDANYPFSGIMANVMHNILTRSFLTELPDIWMVFIEVGLGAIILMLAFRTSALIFSLGSVLATCSYLVLGSALFLQSSVIVNFVRPLLMVGIAFFSFQMFKAIESAYIIRETEKAKYIAERDLEIGRQIQSGFLPDKLPEPLGWQIAAHFKPARQVAGDYYDTFTLLDEKMIGMVIADVCDKGVGAALFMALNRSLIRAFATQNFNFAFQGEVSNPEDIDLAIQATITSTNDYIAVQHGEANMFATTFFGVLDHCSGWLHYINCGHEPPIVIRRDGVLEKLMPSGPAIGMMPHLKFSPKKIKIHPGEILVGYTDGVTDAKDKNGIFFSKDRLYAILARKITSAPNLIEQICTEIYTHMGSQEQHDDVTLIAVGRKESIQS